MPIPPYTLPWLPHIGEDIRCQEFSARTKILDSGCPPQYVVAKAKYADDFKM